jgi:sulfatase modifying factor 1
MTEAVVADAPPGMRAVPGGLFVAGSDDHYPEETPAHPVRVDAFLIDRAPVTNAAFARFVAATGYRTIAERPLDPAEYPGAPAENLDPRCVLEAAGGAAVLP